MMKMKAYDKILTRGLPKTGQSVVYSAGDDGTYQSGWWRGKLNANNKVRYIAKTIGGDDVVIDRATSLMWAADGTAAGCGSGGLFGFDLPCFSVIVRFLDEFILLFLLDFFLISGTKGFCIGLGRACCLAFLFSGFNRRRCPG